MRRVLRTFGFLAITAAGMGLATAAVVPLGAGSYTTALPEGAQRPPPPLRGTENVRGKMPTTDWWSSLAWTRSPHAQFPHPLAVRCEPAGLRVFYPGAGLTANRVAIFGGLPGGANDFTLGHSAETNFAAIQVDGFSDWFVAVRFSSGPNRLRVSYGHGSPFVYATYEGGRPRLVFGRPPQVWSGGPDSPVLGLTIQNRHYGLFGPGGATWTGLGGTTLVCETGGRSHFSIAVLPDNTEPTLALFQRHAHAHVTDTRVEWNYDAASGQVTATFRYFTTAQEPGDPGTVFALYPHQWRDTVTPLLPGTYQSVRGTMKLGRGLAFTTRTPFPGILPALPNVGGCDRALVSASLQAELDRGLSPLKDTYWEGKQLGRLATLIPIAEQYDRPDVAAALHKRLRERLEHWFTATAPDGRLKSRGLFALDESWGTLIGYPGSYGSHTELNDHHFHYGYFLKAAAELARREPAWAAESQWGGMVRLLIRDIASGSREDPLFPFLRCFDPYAGHSWASGHAKFADGNNQESSSEAMNAWAGLILWGEAVGDRELRDLGISLYTTEMRAIEEYWFDVHNENHPETYRPSVVTIVWGGKGANETWFSANPEMVHGINWLPIQGGSLYLGRHPDYVEKNYRALLEENQGPAWDAWADLVWMYRALSDPPDAIRQFEAAGLKYPAEAGNSRANAAHWIYNLNALGQVDRTVTADTPLYAVFQKGQVRTYALYQMRDRPGTVTFSDGHKQAVQGKGFLVAQRSLKPGRPALPTTD